MCALDGTVGTWDRWCTSVKVCNTYMPKKKRRRVLLHLMPMNSNWQLHCLQAHSQDPWMEYLSLLIYVLRYFLSWKQVVPVLFNLFFHLYIWFEIGFFFWRKNLDWLYAQKWYRERSILNLSYFLPHLTVKCIKLAHFLMYYASTLFLSPT